MVRVVRFGAIALLVAGVLLVGLVVSPVRLGSVDAADAASPLDPGDAYVAISGGEVSVGDVVVFWSADRDEFVTRRVVAETESGFLTADGTDAGAHPVPRSAIVATILTIAGRPVVAPGLGAVFSLVGEYWVLVLGLLGLLGGGVIVRERVRRRRPASRRRVVRAGDVIEPLFLVGIATFVGITLLGTATYQVTYVATTDDPGGATIPVGESVTRTISVDAPGGPLTTFVTRARGMTIVDRRTVGGTLELTVSLPAPAEAGTRLTSVQVVPYPAVLPEDTLERLHGVHPVAAVFGTVATAFGPPIVLYRLFVDRNRPVLTIRSGVGRRLGGG